MHIDPAAGRDGKRSVLFYQCAMEDDVRLVGEPGVGSGDNAVSYEMCILTIGKDGDRVLLTIERGDELIFYDERKVLSVGVYPYGGKDVDAVVGGYFNIGNVVAGEAIYVYVKEGAITLFKTD